MAIYDCFQYFNEDHVLDLRFNILDKYVDYFVIAESTKTHQGHDKELKFEINNFKKYKDKIIYVTAEYQKEKNFKNHEGGESQIEQHQRNSLLEGLINADDNDLVILSDSDEIPDLNKLKEINPKKKFIAFSQMMFMYKLNLQNMNESNWIGSRITQKKNITTMQSFRDMKFKNYPFWRIDKYNIQIIKGGWHFSFLQRTDEIIRKIKSYSHGEFNKPELIEKNLIEEKIKNNKDIFNRGYELRKIEIDDRFPKYVRENLGKLDEWII
ncbi:MAG: hypothetical protein CBD76_03385 [Pelagibacteraceae bacterium TMED216]|nr:MAG: hypothetical protein CBD76_03385 [Pelagibacteraceae bacterium TMED216]|tara:strand:+ start:3110 stop:3913 length:804 start_codon:yes stop_codon:yes gene_type:complete